MTEIRKSALRYGEWLALHQVLDGSLCYNYLFIHAWNLYYTTNVVSSSGVVVTCTLERILFLALAVKFEINIKKLKQENKKH